MLTIQYTWSSPISEEAQFSLPPLTCELPRRRRLRHYIIGLPEDTQMAIDRLHLCATPSASTGVAPSNSRKTASSSIDLLHE